MAGALYRDLVRLLKEAGCTFVRQKGSHEIWYSPIAKRHFTVVYDVQKRPTANGSLKHAGLPKAF